MLTCKTNRPLTPLADRGPLRVMFIITSMPVGGAETLLVNLIRRLDREHFLPELCCLKDRGPLGDMLAKEVPTFNNLLAGKYDLRIAWRLPRLLRERRIDAVVTVGAGDKMFWGRLAAARAGVPVVASALHSTGWPDVIGRLNRQLTSITDAFIGVAAAHGRYLADVEHFPAERVHVIPNGVDTDRFRPLPPNSHLREEFGLTANDRVVGIVAALRPEKNHELLLTAMTRVRRQVPDAKLLVVGDGPRRAWLEEQSVELGLGDAVRWLGTRDDIPEVLSLVDLFALVSHMEANPVSILEALACGKPVVATRVGSVDATVHHGETGFLVAPGAEEELAEHIATLLADPAACRRMGENGRRLVEHSWSLDRMVRGYEALISGIYASKCPRSVAKTANAGTDASSSDATGLCSPT